MKKLAILVMAAWAVHALAGAALAVDFKIKGQWIMSFGYGANGNFQGSYNGHETIGWGEGQDNFEAVQRLRLQLDAVASENLSGTVTFEIGETYWGQQSTGGALGADGKIVEVKNAYLDWTLPETAVQVRMGLQNISTPSMASGNAVLDADVAGITVSAQVNDNVALTAFWARPYNDNYLGYNEAYKGRPAGYHANFMDNLDVGGLMVPLTFDNISLTPWGMYGAMGPNTFRNGRSLDPLGNLNANTSEDSSYFMAGMFPAGGARHRDFSEAGSDRHVGSYANMWWAGLTGQGTWDNFSAAFDFEYGAVTWDDDGRLNRSGWFAALLLEYSLDWGVPGLYGWYGSGDDGNPANGSERLPALDPNNANNFSYFAFDGAPYIERYAVIGNNMAGTWGIGARLNNVSFVKDLSHIFRVNYIRGTNSPTMAKKMSLAGLWTNGTVLTPNLGSQGAALGMPGMYLTRLDSALELGSTNSWQVYENMCINVEAGYVFMFLDTGKSVWGARHRNGESIPGTKDAWNVNASFVYSF